jgi:alanine-glyoxylate transaminase / serine-glyoxylate transaminase / serine-pyruvate transaminase
MGPGPSCVPPEVYQALARPTIGHLDPRFPVDHGGHQDAAASNHRHRQFALTLPISGTGSAGMETSFVNLLEAATAS